MSDDCLLNQWCVTLDCPESTPWKLHQYKIEVRDRKIIIWIRGWNTMWFRAENCYIDESKEEVQAYIEKRTFEQLVKTARFTILVGARDD